MLLNENQITERLSGLSGWEFKDNLLRKTFTMKDLETVEKLINQIMTVAENLNHHPDVEKEGNKVIFRVSTHSEGGVTEKDFGLAEEIEEAAEILTE